MSNVHRTTIFAAAFLAAACALWPQPAAAQGIEVIITADNNYAFGWGDENGIQANRYSGGVNNGTGPSWYGCPSSNPVTMCAPPNTVFASPAGCVNPDPTGGSSSGVERWEIPLASVAQDDWFYVVTDSDNGGFQGLLATFQDILQVGEMVRTGDDRWEVCATGDDRVGNGTIFPDLNDNASTSQLGINTWIQRCNRGIADSTNTSGGWVDHTAGAAGRLFPDPTNDGTDNDHVTSAKDINPYGNIGCIDGDASWMWFNTYPTNVPPSNWHKTTNPAGHPLTSAPGGETEHKEFLIFRLPASQVLPPEQCVFVMTERIECERGPMGPSGCYEVILRLRNDTNEKMHFVTVKSLSGGTVSEAVIPVGPSGSGIGPGQQDPNVRFVWCPNTPFGPPSAVTFSLSPLGADGQAIGEECCEELVTFDGIEPCPTDTECFNVPRIVDVACVPGGPPGTFQVRMDIRHNYLNLPCDLYAVAPPGMTVEATSGALPLALPASTNPWWSPTFEVSGAPADGNPRRVCLTFHMKCGRESEVCCTETVCFEAPFCGLLEPTPNPEPTVPPLDASSSSDGSTNDG